MVRCSRGQERLHVSLRLRWIKVFLVYRHERLLHLHPRLARLLSEHNEQRQLEHRLEQARQNAGRKRVSGNAQK